MGLYILLFMINERNIEIADHMSIGEIDELISGYKVTLHLYKRLSFIKSLIQGSTVKEAAESVEVDRRTGYNWLKRYNEGGLDGLIPNFGGGRVAKLSDEQFLELYVILSDKNSNYTIEDVRKLIYEKYGVEYSYKQVWEITRKKLKLNYSKPAPKSPNRPSNRREILKKKLRM